MRQREGNIRRLSQTLLLALLFVSNLAMAQEKSPGNSGSWSGVIIDSGCTVDEAFAEAAKCLDAAPGETGGSGGSGGVVRIGGR